MAQLFSTAYPNNIRNVIAGDFVSTKVFPDDVVLNCNTLTALVPFSIDLLEIPSNYWSTQYKLYICDTGNNASVKNITINAPVGQTINNASSVTINTNGGCVLIRIIDNLTYIATYNAFGSTSVGGYNTIQDEGIAVPQQSIINFIGDTVTAADDAPNSRTNVTIAERHKEGGNSYGAPFTVGSVDAFPVEILAGNVSRQHIDNTNGNTTIGDAAVTAPQKLSVITTDANDGIFVDGATTPTIGIKVSTIREFIIGVATSINDFVLGTQIGDSVIRTNAKSFFVNVFGNVISFFANKVNGRVGVGGATTRATLHINGSIAVPTFFIPEPIGVNTTINLLLRENTTYLSYNVSAGVTLTFTPLTPDLDTNIGNVGRIFFILNTGLGAIDFGGSALVKDKTGGNFTSIGANSSAMFIIMQPYMQQVI